MSCEYLICYDISCPRRLSRIHRCLRRHAIALQYSVFLFEGTAERLERCLDELRALMDEREDDIRAYPLPRRGLRLRIGPATLPGGIHWSGLPETWQDDPALLPDDESGDGNINENGTPASPGAADAISGPDGTDEPGAPSAPSNRKPWTLI